MMKGLPVWLVTGWESHLARQSGSFTGRDRTRRETVTLRIAAVSLPDAIALFWQALDAYDGGKDGRQCAVVAAKAFMDEHVYVDESVLRRRQS